MTLVPLSWHEALPDDEALEPFCPLLQPPAPLLLAEPPLLLLPELLPELPGFTELEPFPELEEDPPFEELGELDELAVAPPSSSGAHGGSLAPHAENAHATATAVRLSVHVDRHVSIKTPEATPKG